MTILNRRSVVRHHRHHLKAQSSTVCSTREGGVAGNGVERLTILPDPAPVVHPSAS